MARARNIKPGFFKNEDLAECSAWARLCFAGLWTLADREGRLEDRAKRIKGELFPFDSIEVEPLLVELARWKFIDRYVVDGVGVIQVAEFKKHQTPHFKEVPSVLPENKSPGLYPHSMNPKPEADPSLNDGKTQDKPEASPGFDPHSTGGQPPLNPESGFLIPDSPSLNPESGVKRAPEPHATPTSAGAACMAMKAVGLQGVNPSHPDLTRLLAAGVTAQELADCAVEAVSTGKRTPFAWVLATVEGRRRDSAERGAVPATGQGRSPATEPEWRREQRERVQQAAPYAAARRDPNPTSEVFDALPPTTR